MLNAMPLVFFVYAAILFGGGMMGFIRAQSVMSLVGSGVFALMSVIAGVVTRSNPNTGLAIGLINALAVAGFFLYRYQQTQKAMPAIPSIALSLVVIALTVAALMTARRVSGS